jgi:molybdopterin converting factor small subunit
VPTVRLRAPLSELADGETAVAVEAATVGEALRLLEQRHTDLRGRILDEHGRIREHVNVFVNGTRGDEATAVAAGDELHVLSAISGG